MFDDLEILCIRSSIIKAVLKIRVIVTLLNSNMHGLIAVFFIEILCSVFFFILLVTEELLPNSLQLQNSR